MADERITLLDIAKANGADALTGLIDETTKSYPEVLITPARTIKGISFKTLVRTALPGAGTSGFRKANQGVEARKGIYENRTFETFIFDKRWEADKAVADRHEDGAEAYIAMEAEGILEQAWQDFGRQYFYGLGANPDGFPGLVDSYDVTNMLVKAGGTTASTQTSVWGVKFGPRYVQILSGNDGRWDLTDVRIETLTDGAGKKFDGYVQGMLAYPGMKVGHKASCGRIANIHPSDANAGWTDDDTVDLITKFQNAGVGRPDVLFANPFALSTLQKSRTATNGTGAPAPIPVESHGIPIQVTNSITSTEAVVA